MSKPGADPERDNLATSERDNLATLDESVEEPGSAKTMAELKAQLQRERQAEAEGKEPRREARANSRDDELLDELPPTDHHLGRFAGWRAARQLRWIVGGVLGLAVLLGVVAFIQHSREMRHERRHPLPEVERLVDPNGPREATYTEGEFRLSLKPEAPYINLVHLPDRDISLARGQDGAQIKVEIRDGKTIKLEVLTGEVVETLTAADAEPLLED